MYGGKSTVASMLSIWVPYIPHYGSWMSKKAYTWPGLLTVGPIIRASDIAGRAHDVEGDNILQHAGYMRAHLRTGPALVNDSKTLPDARRQQRNECVSDKMRTKSVRGLRLKRGWTGLSLISSYFVSSKYDEACSMRTSSFRSRAEAVVSEGGTGVGHRTASLISPRTWTPA